MNHDKLNDKFNDELQNQSTSILKPESSSQHNRWIPILDYAVLKGISTSTLRRRIKTKKIDFKIEAGRYLILADTQTAQFYAERKNPEKTIIRPNWDGFSSGYTTVPDNDAYLVSRVRELEEKLVSAEEQINELKMLIAIYEEKLAGQ